MIRRRDESDIRPPPLPRESRSWPPDRFSRWLLGVVAALIGVAIPGFVAWAVSQSVAAAVTKTRVDELEKRFSRVESSLVRIEGKQDTMMGIWGVRVGKDQRRGDGKTER